MALSTSSLHCNHDWIELNREIFADGYYNYYIQKNAGSYTIIKDYEEERIQALMMDTSEKNMIKRVYEELDLLLDIDFREESYQSNADVTLQKYRANNSSAALDSYLIDEESTTHWNLLWADVVEGRLSTYEKRSLRHEIGHTLGLSHPDNHPEQEGLTSRDTIMSYNNPEGISLDSLYYEDVVEDKLWLSGSDFSQVDIQALQELWGVENDFRKIERNGKVSCVTDWNDRVVVLKEDGTRHYVRNGEFAFQQSKEAKVIAAETIRGINEVAVQNYDGIISFWQCDADWNFERLNGASSLEHNSIIIAENEYMQDFTMNGVIGEM